MTFAEKTKKGGTKGSKKQERVLHSPSRSLHTKSGRSPKGHSNVRRSRNVINRSRLFYFFIALILSILFVLIIGSLITITLQ